MKDFAKRVAQKFLDIEDKNRSNLFAWRGQFSPQLIETLLNSYCPSGSVILDPFSGCGTVLYEAARKGLSAYGFEINPSAWSYSKLYEYANVPIQTREKVISELGMKIRKEFPIVIFSETEIPLDEVEARIVRIGESICDLAMVLCNALVVLLDIFKNSISGGYVQHKFRALSELVLSLPYSEGLIKADLHDARSLPLEDQSIDFVLTSPPYINVFNYHQNYRRSVEMLGWDVLRVARSEIGSNRANRGNRFLTVIQYCIDIASTLEELIRVVKPGGRLVLIVGYESNVLGVPFHNADIVERIASGLGLFNLSLRQSRVFKNRFGRSIREDILNLVKSKSIRSCNNPVNVGRIVSSATLEKGLEVVSKKNKALLLQAISRVDSTNGTPVFGSSTYNTYQTRDNVMMVKEEKEG